MAMRRWILCAALLISCVLVMGQGTHKNNRFARVGSRQGIGAAAVETLSVLFRSDLQPSGLHGSWPSGWTPDATDSTSFKYGYVRDGAAYEDTCSTTYLTYRVYAYSKGTAGPNAVNHRRVMMRWDLDGSIPDNKTILSARLCWIAYDTKNIGANGYFKVALDTTGRSATPWWQIDPYSAAQSNGDTEHTRVTWNSYDDETNDPWSPATDDEDDYWDYGIVSQVEHYKGASWSAGDTMSFDVTDIVQQYVAAKATSPRNAGFNIWVYGGTVTTYGIRSGDFVANDGIQPFLVVRYSTVRYTGPWFGKPICFVFQTDDGRRAANDTYRAIFESYGWKYGLGIVGRYVGSGSALTKTEIQDYYDNGFPVFNHGVHFGADEGMPNYAGDIAGDIDSTKDYINPADVSTYTGAVAILDTLDFLSWTDIVSAGYAPGGAGHSWTVDSLVAEWYPYMRVGDINPVPTWLDNCAWPAGCTDTGTYLAWSDTANVYGISRQLGPSTTTSQAETNEWMEDAIGTCMANGNALLFQIVHGTDELTGQQLTWELQFIQNHGHIVVKTMEQAMDWYFAFHEPCLCEEGTHMNDDQGVTAADSMCWKLKD